MKFTDLEYAEMVKKRDALQAENDALRKALADRNERYWNLHNEVETLYRNYCGAALNEADASAKGANDVRS